MSWGNAMGAGMAWMWIFPVLFLMGLALFSGVFLRGCEDLRAAGPRMKKGEEPIQYPRKRRRRSWTDVTPGEKLPGNNISKCGRIWNEGIL